MASNHSDDHLKPLFPGVRGSWSLPVATYSVACLLKPKRLAQRAHCVMVSNVVRMQSGECTEMKPGVAAEVHACCQRLLGSSWLQELKRGSQQVQTNTTCRQKGDISLKWVDCNFSFPFFGKAPRVSGNERSVCFGTLRSPAAKSHRRVAECSSTG